MKKETSRFRQSVVARAIFIACSGTVMTLGVSTQSMAQSNTNGIIYGQVAAGSGTSIVIENVGTGAKRTVSPDTTGRFQATAVPPGQYRATLLNGTNVVGTSQVEVQSGQGSELAFTPGTSLSTVQIVGRTQTIDTSTANAGATFTARQMEQLPIARDIASVVQLAPSTAKADFRYGNNAASFGGSGSSENAVYINGYTVTNGLYQVGYPSLPFGAIATANVITGGYGAEFGRSTGGVINITTKSGSNDF